VDTRDRGGRQGGGAFNCSGAVKLGRGVEYYNIDGFNKYFFLSRFKDLNRILRRRPHPTHCEEVPGVRRLLIPIAMPSGLAFGSAMVVLFF
jgi:hypothetical protein